MLLVRLNQLAAGGSGISPAVLDALAAMLADDITDRDLTGDLARAERLPESLAELL